MTLLFERLFSKFSSNDHEFVINAWKQSNAVPSLDPLSAKVAAGSYFCNGDYSHAFDLLEQIESCFDSDSSYYSLFGATCRRLGDLKRADTLLSRALQLDPTSLPAKNNYANLLIDLNRFDQARVLLLEVLDSDPNFQDSTVNLKRLDDVEHKVSTTNAVSHSDESCQWKQADPLLLAFSNEEVLRTRSLIMPTATSNSSKKILHNLPTSNENKIVHDQLTVAIQAVSDSEYLLALNLCTSVYRSAPPDLIADVYDVAADAYIGLKSFNYAEICYSCSANLKGYSFKHLFNLATLASMRSDILLARTYLSRAREMQPDNPILNQLNISLNQSAHRFAFKPEWDFVSVS